MSLFAFCWQQNNTSSTFWAIKQMNPALMESPDVTQKKVLFMRVEAKVMQSDVN